MHFKDSYDIIIVGAGIAGLAAAYFYKEAFTERTVLVLEKKGAGRTPGLGGIGAGLTGRSGGHRMPGFEADYSEIEKLLGPQRALALYQETLRMSEETDVIIEKLGITCGARHGYWIVDERPEEFTKLDEFMRPRRALNLPEPRFYEGAALKAHVHFNGYQAGLEFPDIASFDTPKFIYGLAAALQQRGVDIAQGYTYVEHAAARRGRRDAALQPHIQVRLAGGQNLRARHLVLAGGDILTRKIPFLHKRTATVYTGRVGVRLMREDFQRISPQGYPLSGCDSDLKSNQNPLEGDFLWFSLRADGYLAMGFGGCFGSTTPQHTRDNLDKMMGDVKRELYERLPFLERGRYRIKPTIGGLNTSSNLLPIIGPVGKLGGVYAIAAQSGVGLNQSLLMAKALVQHMKGDHTLYDMLLSFERGQVIIPRHPVLRRAALEIGVLEKNAKHAPVRTVCGIAHGAAWAYTRLRTPSEKYKI